MLKLQLLLAAAAVDPTTELPASAQTSNAFGGTLREMLLIIGTAAVLALTLFLYVYITRRDRRIHTSSTGSRAIYRHDKRKPREEDDGHRKMRKKRRRSEEFSNRNPTLGETGGLPPLRDEPAEPAQ